MRKRLCNEIDALFSRPLQSPKDFEQLAERIFARLHVMIGRTTLMRVWGYVDDGSTPRDSTFDILSQFLGYKNWQEYQNNALLPKEQQSSPVLGRRLSVAEELKRGDKIRLIWQPGRVCDIEYLGELKFRVVSSEGTRLHEGDTFKCSLIVEKEPLYLDDLCQGEHPTIAYVCGKRDGVMFELIE
ncbi:MAG: hypothetical protein IJT90_06705 [Bacteroidaceae bacterium]|nr:hypothetical protein [Bacteroidaceae bacterium]